MTKLRGLASIIAVAAITAFVAGCSSGGGYGAAPASATGASVVPVPAVVAPSTAASSAASSAAPATAGTGGGKYDYGTGSGASASAGGSTATGGVLLSGFAFEPAHVSVAAGSSITFTNQDSVRHVLVEGQNGTPASAGAPQSKVAPGQTVSIPFATAGTVKMTCTIHPSMNLTVTVTP